MTSSSNLNKVGLKKSFSSKSFASEPAIQKNYKLFSRQPTEFEKLSETDLNAEYRLENPTAANFSIATCDEGLTRIEEAKMAHLQQQIFPVNSGGFNSISSIASEGQNHNFASVQSIQTKHMMKNLTTQQQSGEYTEKQTATFNFNTGDTQLDRLLQQTLVYEINGLF